MITYRTEKRDTKILESVTCDVCKKEYKYADNIENLEAQEFQHIRVDGGYGSVFGDGNKLSADICQNCFKKIMGKYLVEDKDGC